MTARTARAPGAPGTSGTSATSGAAARAGKAPRRIETRAAGQSRLHRFVDDLSLRLSRRARPLAGDFRLDRRVIYILPSRAGLVFGGALVTMLLAAINYSLQLGYLLTFLLFSIALVSMLLTWRNMAGLVLRSGRAEPVHAGEIAEFSLTVRNGSNLPRYALQFDVPDAARSVLVDAAPDAETATSLALPTRERGRMTLPRIRLSSTFPLGLWRAWSYWHPAVSVVIWPSAETPVPPLPAGLAQDGRTTGSGPGEEDFSAVRPYRDGDSPRRLAWKAMARSGNDEPLTKDFDGGVGGELALDWRALPASLDTESRLSRLCAWVLLADQQGLRFALVLPHVTLGPDNGPGHTIRCLDALALYGRADPLDRERRGTGGGARGPVR